MKKRFEQSQERRRESIAERRNLEQRKQIRDRRYHTVDEILDTEDYAELQDEYNERIR